DRHDLVPARDLEERAAPIALASEVGHDDDERALLRHPAERLESLRERAQAGAVLLERERRLVALAQREQQADEAGATLPGRHDAYALPAEADEPDAVAADGRGVADRERRAQRDVGLPPLGGAEGHRRRGVEHDPAH